MTMIPRTTLSSHRSFDPRVTAARPDLAATSLRGVIEAERFADGETFSVVSETLDMRRRPRPDAPLETQLLYGETLTVFDEDNGWGWAQAKHDDYVGYVAMGALQRRRPAAPTHHVVVNRTFVYPAADMKQPPLATLPLGGLVSVESACDGFLKLSGFGFVFAKHLTRLGEQTQDFVSVAEQLVGVPYLWGGRSALGIDCSGLVQLARGVTNVAMPRDTDMQEDIGEALPFGETLAGLERGDLVFWRGHVGIMTDASMLLHANAHHMLVAREPLISARARTAATGSQITSIRRFRPCR